MARALVLGTVSVFLFALAWHHAITYPESPVATYLSSYPLINDALQNSRQWGNFVFQKQASPHSSHVQTEILGERLRAIAKSGTKTCKSVAVGYNSNLDLIVRAAEVLRALNVSASALENRRDREQIGSLQDLEELISVYLEKGSAAERFAEKKTFDTIVKASNSLEHKSVFVGGNAALMANRFASEGCEKVILGGVVGETLASLLHPAIILASSFASGKSSEKIEEEVHLILEYERGAKWGNIVAPRANRFIAHSDEKNAKLQPMDGFHSAVTISSPSLVVLSGFHLVEGQSVALRQERIQKVADFLSDKSLLSFSSPVHIELASIATVSYMKQIVDLLISHTNSLGLNEQELGSVYSAIGGSEFSQNEYKDPKVTTVISSIKKIFEFEQGHRPSSAVRGLTRVHFHCLAFHVVAQRSGSLWKGSREAVVAGAVAASTQACNMQNVELHLPLDTGITNGNKKLLLDPEDPVISWSDGGLDFYLAPVLVCKNPSKTVGLGDAISAVGLIHQRFE